MNLLHQIREGMDVYDSTGERVGTVEYVHFGDENPARPGPEAATPSPMLERDPTLVDMVAEAFSTDDIPEELQQRLRLHGFVKVDFGLLRSDRYILPDQIAGVSADKVHLNVSQDELVSS